MAYIADFYVAAVAMKTHNLAGTAPCYQTIPFIVPLVVMATILVLSLGMLCHFYSRMRQMMAQQQKCGPTNPPYKY